MSLHPYVAAELNRQRRADLLAAAQESRRARALRQRALDSPQPAKTGVR